MYYFPLTIHMSHDAVMPFSSQPFIIIFLHQTNPIWECRNALWDTWIDSGKQYVIRKWISIATTNIRQCLPYKRQLSFQEVATAMVTTNLPLMPIWFTQHVLQPEKSSSIHSFNSTSTYISFTVFNPLVLSAFLEM